MSFQDYKKPSDMNGKTIESSDLIRAEFGRTADWYLCLKFTDGTRMLIGATGFGFYSPTPDAKEMRKAQNFFTAEEITEKINKDERVRQSRERYKKDAKLRMLRDLQRELGVEPASSDNQNHRELPF